MTDATAEIAALLDRLEQDEPAHVREFFRDPRVKDLFADLPRLTAEADHLLQRSRDLGATF